MTTPNHPANHMEDRAAFEQWARENMPERLEKRQLPSGAVVYRDAKHEWAWRAYQAALSRVRAAASIGEKL